MTTFMELVAGFGIFVVGYAAGAMAMSAEYRKACVTCQIRKNAEKQGETGK